MTTLSTCYHCGSDDTMMPFRRAEHVLVLSRLFPALRRRYCRTCTRHFLVFGAVAPTALRDDGHRQHLIMPEAGPDEARTGARPDFEFAPGAAPFIFPDDAPQLPPEGTAFAADASIVFGDDAEPRPLEKTVLADDASIVFGDEAEPRPLERTVFADDASIVFPDDLEPPPLEGTVFTADASIVFPDDAGPLPLEDFPFAADPPIVFPEPVRRRRGDR